MVEMVEQHEAKSGGEPGPGEQESSSSAAGSSSFANAGAALIPSSSTAASIPVVDPDRHATQGMASTDSGLPSPGTQRRNSNSWQPFMGSNVKVPGNDSSVWSPNDESAFPVTPVINTNGMNSGKDMSTPVQGVKRKRDSSVQESPLLDEKQKKIRSDEKEVKFKEAKDYWCWSCHKDRAVVSCTTCCRSFHTKCLTTGVKNNPKPFICMECKALTASIKRPPKALRGIDAKELNELILTAAENVKTVSIIYRQWALQLMIS